jgi:hypothetical protein
MLMAYDDGTTYVEITQPFIGHVVITYGPISGPRTGKNISIPGRMPSDRKVRVILDEVERLTGLSIVEEVTR